MEKERREKRVRREGKGKLRRGREVVSELRSRVKGEGSLRRGAEEDCESVSVVGAWEDADIEEGRSRLAVGVDIDSDSRAAGCACDGRSG